MQKNLWIHLKLFPGHRIWATPEAPSLIQGQQLIPVLQKKKELQLELHRDLMRLSVGLENLQDIIEDVEQALQKSKNYQSHKGIGNNSQEILIQ